jgi:multidrug resistance efflux pump
VIQKPATAANDTPEKIGTLTCITSPLWWIIVAVLVTMGGAVVLWSLLGEIFVTVSGLGLVVPAQGEITVVPVKAAGRVVKVAVKENDLVRQGDLIAEINQAHLQSQLEAAQTIVSTMKIQRERQGKQSQEYLARRESGVRDQIAALQAKLKSLKDSSAFRAKVLVDMEDEMKQGFATRTQLEQARNDKITTDLNLRDTASQIETLRTQLEEDRSAAQRQLFSLDQEILKAQQQADDYERTLMVAQKIVAPIDGRVASLATAEGKMVSVEDVVAIMEPISAGVGIAAYFQIADGKQIQPGAKARVKIGSIDSDVYGTATGTVVFVSDLPSTTESLKNTIENKPWCRRSSGLERRSRCSSRWIRFPTSPGW